MSNENDNQPKIEIEEENDEILNEDENNQDSDYLMEEKITPIVIFTKI